MIIQAIFTIHHFIAVPFMGRIEKPEMGFSPIFLTPTVITRHNLILLIVLRKNANRFHITTFVIRIKRRFGYTIGLARCGMYK